MSSKGIRGPMGWPGQNVPLDAWVEAYAKLSSEEYRKHRLLVKVGRALKDSGQLPDLFEEIRLQASGELDDDR